MAEAEAALHGRLQRLAAEQHACGGGDALEDDDAEGYDEDREPVLAQDGGLYEHAYRHEEDGAEEVLQWGHQTVYHVGLDGLGKDGAHDEGAQGGAESGLGSQHHHAEA